MYYSVRLLQKQIKYLDKEAVAIARVQPWHTGSYSKLVKNDGCRMHTTTWALLEELDSISLLEEEKRMALISLLLTGFSKSEVKHSNTLQLIKNQWQHQVLLLALTGSPVLFLYGSLLEVKKSDWSALNVTELRILKWTQECLSVV